MNRPLREKCDRIIQEILRCIKPEDLVVRALEDAPLSGRIIMVAAGKAAWSMGRAAADRLGERLKKGIVITKYRHSGGVIPRCRIFEAGHPLPDENSLRATEAALKLVADLHENDTVLFLLSGGGSALFEKPLIPLEELRDINAQLLASGADITEINIIRKRLSAVKGGGFALACAPARVEALIISDVLGDRLDMIASGPVTPDESPAGEARRVAEKYGISMSDEALSLLDRPLPRKITNVRTSIIGNISLLCRAAAEACRAQGYEPVIITEYLAGEAKAAGRWLGEEALNAAASGKKIALIAGGETVVKLTGDGSGGRNQEAALAAAELLRGRQDIALFFLGSDGTDGPTDAAGGYADGDTAQALENQGLAIQDILEKNDSYHGLQQSGGLIITGPTGTNLNDIAVALVDGTF